MNLYVLVTRRCMLRCRCCLNDSSAEAPPGLSTGELLTALDWLAQQPDPGVHFTGGEPLLRTDLAQLVDGAADRGIRVTVCSNGWAIGRPQLRWLHRCHQVILTFYGLTATHDSMTGRPGSYARALDALSLLRGAGVRTRANVVVTASALPELGGLALQLAQRGASQIKLSQLALMGRARDMPHEQATPAQLETCTDAIRALDLGATALTVGSPPASGAFRCRAVGGDELFLGEDGRVHRCSLFVEDRLPPGALDHAEPGTCPATVGGAFRAPPGFAVAQGCPPTLVPLSGWR